MDGSLASASSHNVRPDVFLKYWRDIRDAKTAHQETGMTLARLKKDAKNYGIDLAALKMLEKLSDLDSDEAAIQLRHLRDYAAWVELPVGTQLDAFGPPVNPSAEATQKQRDHVARTAGEAAAKASSERDQNPHQAGSSEHVAWDKGWLKGHKDWLAEQKTLAGDLARNSRSRSKGTTTKGKRNNGSATATLQ